MTAAGPGHGPWYRRPLIVLPAGLLFPVAGAATLVTLRSRTSTTDLAVLTLSAVLAVAATGSRLGATLAAVSATASFDLFLTHPYGSLLIHGGQGQLATLAVLVFGLALGQLGASGDGRAGRGELLAVVLVAGLSQAVPEAGRWLVARQGIDGALAILVFATITGLPAGAFSGGPSSGGAFSGGPSSGGAFSGGAFSGGAFSGGAFSGGPSSGGPSSGGSSSGGSSSDGAFSGGSSSGGAVSGGSFLGGRARRIGLILLVSSLGLLALAWGASRLVITPVLRRGILALGVAPAEIGSVATTAIGAGDTATAAMLLIGSTLITVVLGPAVLSLLDAGARLHPLAVLGNLALVVAAPMAVGLLLRTVLPERARRAASAAAFAALVMLVALVSSEVALGAAYLRVAGAVMVFVAGSTILGGLLGLGVGRKAATGVLLTTSMRDFAVAAAVASAAAGPAAAAPLSLYGVLAIVWGVALAGWRRRRP